MPATKADCPFFLIVVTGSSLSSQDFTPHRAQRLFIPLESYEMHYPTATGGTEIKFQMWILKKMFITHLDIASSVRVQDSGRHQLKVFVEKHLHSFLSQQPLLNIIPTNHISLPLYCTDDE